MLLINISLWLSYLEQSCPVQAERQWHRFGLTHFPPFKQGDWQTAGIKKKCMPFLNQHLAVLKMSMKAHEIRLYFWLQPPTLLIDCLHYAFLPLCLTSCPCVARVHCFFFFNIFIYVTNLAHTVLNCEFFICSDYKSFEGASTELYDSVITSDINSWQ